MGAVRPPSLSLSFSDLLPSFSRLPVCSPHVVLITPQLTSEFQPEQVSGFRPPLPSPLLPPSTEVVVACDSDLTASCRRSPVCSPLEVDAPKLLSGFQLTSESHVAHVPPLSLSTEVVANGSDLTAVYRLPPTAPVAPTTEVPLPPSRISPSPPSTEVVVDHDSDLTADYHRSPTAPVASATGVPPSSSRTLPPPPPTEVTVEHDPDLIADYHPSLLAPVALAAKAALSPLLSTFCAVAAAHVETLSPRVMALPGAPTANVYFTPISPSSPPPPSLPSSPPGTPDVSRPASPAAASAPASAQQPAPLVDAAHSDSSSPNYSPPLTDSESPTPKRRRGSEGLPPTGSPARTVSDYQPSECGADEGGQGLPLAEGGSDSDSGSYVYVNVQGGWDPIRSTKTNAVYKNLRVRVRRRRDNSSPPSSVGSPSFSRRRRSLFRPPSPLAKLLPVAVSGRRRSLFRSQLQLTGLSHVLRVSSGFSTAGPAGTSFSLSASRGLVLPTCRVRVVRGCE